LLLTGFSWRDGIRANSGPVATGGGGGDITTGLIGYWNCDAGSGTALADTGSGAHNGTLNNGVTWVTGLVGTSALNFASASSQYVAVGNFDDQTTTSFTLSFRAKFASQASNYIPLIAKEGAGAGWSVFIDGTAASGSQTVFAKLVDGTTTIYPSTSTGLDNSTSHLITLVVDRTANNAYFYVDHVLVDTQSIVGLGSLSNAIGLSFGTYDNTVYFNGILDDIRIYNRALVQADVNLLP
jgi:hypothetical protein